MLLSASLLPILTYRAPAFVSKSTVVQDDDAPDGLADEKKDGSSGNSGGSSSEESDSEEEQGQCSPRIREEEEEVAVQPSMGLGARPKGPGRGGIGSAARAAAKEDSASASEASTPAQNGQSLFGRRAAETTAPTSTQSRRSFVPKAEVAAPVASTPLTAKEAKAFQATAGSFGAKYLSNLGWAPGKGLGLNEDGRAVPVDAGRHMKGQGISSGIRTEDSKREARRKGELISDDSEDERAARRAKGKGKSGQKAAPQDQSWKKQRKVKVKVAHKTYEQILEESEQAPQVGLVIDARGGEVSCTWK